MPPNSLKRTKTPSKNYKYQQLQTVRLIAVIPSTGVRFVNGVSNQYSTELPPSLKNEVDEKKFVDHMEHLNFKLKMYWPCCFAYYCGYFCIPITLGLSLLLPRVCVSEAEAVLLREIAKLNRDVLGNSKLQMRLVKKCCDSFLMIEERDFAEFELGGQDGFTVI